MSAPTPHRHRGYPSGPRRDVRLAWASVLLTPFAFLGAFGVGEGLISAQGYSVGTDTPPMLPTLLATVPALLIFALPAFVSAYFARRAGAGGSRGGWIPAALLLVLAAVFALVNLLPLGQ